MSSQLMFDFDALDTPETVEVAPMRFHQGLFDPLVLDAAWIHWQREHGSFDSCARSHMWRVSGAVVADTLMHLTAELRPGVGFQGPGELLHQFVTFAGDWHYIGDWESCVAAWHDHRWPGWRDLPVKPAKAKPEVWVAQLPEPWQVLGAPIITERSQSASRSVPGRSPQGGFDIASIRQRGQK